MLRVCLVRNFFAPGRGCKVLWRVCRSVCLSTRVTRKPRGRTSPNFCACGSVLLWRRCDTLCTSGFVDCGWRHVLISRGPGDRIKSSPTICLEWVRQVAVPMGRQGNYSVWSSSSECGTGDEVCYLWLTCFDVGLSLIISCVTRMRRLTLSPCIYRVAQLKWGQLCCR